MSTVTLLNPYQKVGTVVPEGMTAEEALEYAGLSGWNQRLVEPIVVDNLTEYPAGKYRYNVADLPTGPSVLGAVKKSYRPIQNEEAFLPLMDAATEKGLVPIVLGAYDDGAASFIQFSVPDGTKVVVGDRIATTVLITKRNDGEGSVRGFCPVERLFCANQINGIAKTHQPMVAVRHTKGADAHVAQTIERLLGITQDWNGIVAKQIEELAAQPVSKQFYVDAFLDRLLGGRPEEEGNSQTIYDRKFDELVRAWDSPVAAEGNTAWRAFNAVSEWEQHWRTSNENRMALAVLHNRQPVTARALHLLGA